MMAARIELRKTIKMIKSLKKQNEDYEAQLSQFQVMKEALKEDQSEVIVPK
jgi:hypothetical protein